MTAKHRVTLVWTTIYSLSCQSEKNCLELGAQSGKKSLVIHLPGAAGTMWQGIVAMRLSHGVAEGKGGAFGATWAAPSLTAQWSCSSWGMTCHLLTRVAQKGENDTGWHQPSSLSICHTLQLVPNMESKLSAEAPLIPLKIPHPKQAERELSSEVHPPTEPAEDGPQVLLVCFKHHSQPSLHLCFQQLYRNDTKDAEEWEKDVVTGCHFPSVLSDAVFLSLLLNASLV